MGAALLSATAPHARRSWDPCPYGAAPVAVAPIRCPNATRDLSDPSGDNAATAIGSPGCRLTAGRATTALPTPPERRSGAREEGDDNRPDEREDDRGAKKPDHLFAPCLLP